MRGRARRPRALTAAVAALLVVWGGSVEIPASGDPAPPTAFTPGDGSAAGEAMAINLAYGGAELGVNVAQASAQYQDATGTASGAPLQSGLLTIASQLEYCGVKNTYPPGTIPVATTVSTNSNDNRGPVSGTSGGGSRSAGVGVVNVSARPRADGTADVEGVTLDLPALVSVVGGGVHAEATTVASRLDRTAGADVTQDVNLLGGAIGLHGLHWHAAAEVVGADSKSDTRRTQATFAVGSISIGAAVIPFPDNGSLQSALDTVNPLIAPLGVQLHLPGAVTTRNGGASLAQVGPLVVALGGKTVVGPVLQALLGGQTLPALEAALKPGVFDPTACKELFGALTHIPELNALYNSLGATLPIAIAALIGSVDGTGELDLDLGGASASVDDSYYPSLSFGAPPTGFSAATPPVAATPGEPLPVPPPASSPSAPAVTVPARTQLAVSTARRCLTTSPVGAPSCWVGHAGVAAIAAGGLTLGLLAADEATRRRRTRRGGDSSAHAPTEAT